MKLNKNQIDTLSKYFSDLSKIIFASAVIGFFVPSGAGPVTLLVFFGGSLVATGCIIFSLRLMK